MYILRLRVCVSLSRCTFLLLIIIGNNSCMHAVYSCICSDDNSVPVFHINMLIYYCVYGVILYYSVVFYTNPAVSTTDTKINVPSVLNPDLISKVHSLDLLVSWCFEPGQPQSIISGLGRLSCRRQ